MGSAGLQSTLTYELKVSFELVYIRVISLITSLVCGLVIAVMVRIMAYQC